jgi:hypothetical protein
LARNLELDKIIASVAVVSASVIFALNLVYANIFDLVLCSIGAASANWPTLDSDANVNVDCILFF